MRKQIVLGLGEIGGPLRNILNCAGFDSKGESDTAERLGVFEVLHICIPYSDNFIEVVRGYQAVFKPEITVIHSTVPIGTTCKIENAVHSPILGKHSNMEQSIRDFTKWIGGPLALAASSCFTDVGIKTKCVPKATETELFKLVCLAKYGKDIAFAGYVKGLCDIYGIDCNDMIKWDGNYNAHVQPYLMRPLIDPPKEKISGHCVIPGTRLLNEQHHNLMLDEVLKYA